MFFKKKQSPHVTQSLTQDEQRLATQIANSLTIYGISPSDAASQAEQIVRAAITRVKASGKYGASLPSREEILFRFSEQSNPPDNIRRHTDDLRNLGGTDEDIVKFWQCSLVETHSMFAMHDVVKTTVWMGFMDDGLDEHQAAMKMRRTLVTCAMLTSELPPGCVEQDRDIPWELNYRVMSWIASKPRVFIDRRSEYGEETVNASVRHFLLTGQVSL